MIRKEINAKSKIRNKRNNLDVGEETNEAIKTKKFGEKDKGCVNEWTDRD